MASSSSGPTPALCERMMLRCRSVRCARRDARLREQAKAGVDAVRGRIAGGEARGDRVRLRARRASAAGSMATVDRDLRYRRRRSARRSGRAPSFRESDSAIAAPRRAHHGAARVEANPVAELLDGSARSRPRSRPPGPAASAPRSPASPSACAAWRVTPCSASSAVSPNRRVAMLIASSSEVPGAEPGLQSLAIAIAAPRLRAALPAGGLRASARQ